MTAQDQVEAERVSAPAEDGDPIAALRGWLQSRTELWRRYDESATPAERADRIAQLRVDRQRFEAETRRLGG